MATPTQIGLKTIKEERVLPYPLVRDFRTVEEWHAALRTHRLSMAHLGEDIQKG